MTAKEMFEEWGYKLNKEIARDDDIIYTKGYACIVFNIPLKNYCIRHIDDYINGNDGIGELIEILPQEHLAIHQQLIELGWIE